jgi:hypothetical protein
MVKALFTYQELKRDYLWAWFAESHDIVVENLSSQDHLIYHKTKKCILNLNSNHHFFSRALSKNSNPQHDAKDVSSSHRKKDMKMKKDSSSSSNSSNLEYN